MDSYIGLASGKASQRTVPDGRPGMAFEKVDARIEREDHSGGHAHMRQIALNRDQELKREGPHGSLGVWILEERSICKRLNVTGV